MLLWFLRTPYSILLKSISLSVCLSFWSVEPPLIHHSHHHEAHSTQNTQHTQTRHKTHTTSHNTQQPTANLQPKIWGVCLVCCSLSLSLWFTVAVRTSRGTIPPVIAQYKSQIENAVLHHRRSRLPGSGCGLHARWKHGQVMQQPPNVMSSLS